MSNNNSNNTSVLNYTEDHKATVKEFSFTGALPDQTAYLATVNELNRFFTRFPTLKNVLSANDQQYNRVPGVSGYLVIARRRRRPLQYDVCQNT